MVATRASPDALPDVDSLRGRFPPTFRWGAATSAYQVEGAPTADGRGVSIWDAFSETPGRTANGETGDPACDHYRRWEADVELMAGMGLRAYRFSVAWPRVQPAGSGRVEPRGLDFYERLVDALLARGIEPWVTLYHWDLPQALEDRGGWTDPDMAPRFAEFAAIVARRLGDRVRHWITLNEPRTFSLMGYGTGRHAPGRRGWGTALRAAHEAHLAHAAAVRSLRAERPGGLVGICHDVADLVPASDSVEDAAATVRHDGVMHRWFLDPSFGRGYPSDLLAWYDAHGFLDGIDPTQVEAAEPIDFLALNYYRRERIATAPVEATWGVGARVVDGIGEHAGNGWEIHPRGLRDVLDRLRRDYAPAAIAVTENGATFPDAPAPDGSVADVERRSYLARHIEAAAGAIEDGVPLIGYFAWSLLDNFEWALGYGTRFGIVHVDFESQRRTIKASGEWYTELIGGGAPAS